jgi:hypothetical protein
MVTDGTGWVNANHKELDAKSKNKKGRLGSTYSLVEN